MWQPFLWTGCCVAFLGCSSGGKSWPPTPRSEEEKQIITAVERAVLRQDQWDNIACVATKQKGGWQVTAWKVVHPEARGRNRCVPWSVRKLTMDERGTVLDYSN